MTNDEIAKLVLGAALGYAHDQAPEPASWMPEEYLSLDGPSRDAVDDEIDWILKR